LQPIVTQDLREFELPSAKQRLPAALYKFSLPPDCARKRRLTFDLALYATDWLVSYDLLRVGSFADWHCLDVQAAKGLCHTGIHQGASLLKHRQLSHGALQAADTLVA